MDDISQSTHSASTSNTPATGRNLNLNVSSRQRDIPTQGLVNPNVLKTKDGYLKLDASSRQSNAAYQGLVNPDDLKTNDNYLRLDDSSRNAETKYQGLKRTPDSDNDSYEEITDSNTDQREFEVPEMRIPTPPQVKGVDTSNSRYVNVNKKVKNVRRPAKKR